MEGQDNEPLFLKGKSRDTVLVGEDEICKVLSFVGGARDPLAPTLFQVANVDTGEIKFVHGEEVREIVSTYEQEVQKDLNLLILMSKVQPYKVSNLLIVMDLH